MSDDLSAIQQTEIIAD